MLAQAISSTVPVIAISTHSGVESCWRKYDARPCEPGSTSMDAPQKFLARKRRCVAERRLLHFHFEHGVHERLQRALACAAVTPGFSRPNAFTQRVRRSVSISGVAAGISVRLHHDRHEDLRRVAQLHAIESLLRDADDGHVVLIHENFLPDHLRDRPRNASASSRSSAPRTDVRSGMRSSSGVNVRPDRRVDAEHRKIGARNQLRFYTLRVAAEARLAGAVGNRQNIPEKT